MPDQKLSEADAHFVARVRRFMIFAVGGTFLALAIVLALIGYRLSQSGKSAPSTAAVPATAAAPASATLPAGAKVLTTTIGEGHIVLTVEVDGALELRTFDLYTLKPLGRLRLSPQR
ncbi:MAG TPA: hypothetical protein VFT69_19705 [Pseudolabrys sp.]|nr:hypothetical protein [Pseudolabrys sp.]